MLYKPRKNSTGQLTKYPLFPSSPLPLFPSTTLMNTVEFAATLQMKSDRQHALLVMKCLDGTRTILDVSLEVYEELCLFGSLRWKGNVCELVLERVAIHQMASLSIWIHNPHMKSVLEKASISRVWIQ
ncbi:hypothetical protein M408DRAFT_24364 [Serendipita vermifera MAFF 305830]|uniref:Uncharacterized protein n=1 Tax=Serendipita vermifera MAFF 305830 TaxID=933852 RepID=A0A0C3AT26_SERVB|nr:hypothetical protein M408DRAFT_24364 [Serendipita vermifera MAFF 305830]